MNEFSVINRYFKNLSQQPDVILGIGDDCACCEVPAGHVLLTSTDTLICGVHFPESTAAFDVGYKALAVNLSDMAAMGAKPAWASLALTMPEVDEAWLKDFCEGMTPLLSRYKLSLVGGDLCAGPLSLSIFIQGYAKPDKYMLRSGAKPGDKVFVTAELGSAGIGLQVIKNKLQLEASLKQKALTALNRPEPQVEIGAKLAGLATSAIDISDGLVSDLGHILKASAVGAEVHLNKLPFDKALFASEAAPRQGILSFGDDYQLCFTLPAARISALADINGDFTEIGVINDDAATGLTLLDEAGQPVEITDSGYQHF